ncbi:hypothetical protein HMPREF2531_03483 [Bacteroides intestinalis]|uniref:Uncharacterized protein n=1 Tax=Bacteroides intestinalis TaxID=329854 RepID=A0A139L2G3_9BACE|nr:hypothetical protein HMPREF2531_03483 [Bacteroides intestinalis]
MEGYNLLLPRDERFPIGDMSFIAFTAKLKSEVKIRFPTYEESRLFI